MDKTNNASQLYLQQLGIFNEILEQTLENLNRLLELHVQNIAFGNFNPFLGLPVELDITTLVEKILVQGRDAYCFEHNVLAKNVLNELGYDAFNLLCRVYYKSHPTESPAKTHLVTIVRLNSALYLFDPGFGGMTPTSVLSIHSLETSQATLNEPFRLIHVIDSGVIDSALLDMKYMLQVCVSGEWENVYAFNPEQIAADSDIKIANWFMSTYPKCSFTRNLILSIVKQDKRYNFSNGVLNIHNKNNQTQQQIIKSVDELKEIFISIFKLNLDALNIDDAIHKFQAL